jgi:hypothetical protein
VRAATTHPAAMMATASSASAVARVQMGMFRGYSHRLWLRILPAPAPGGTVRTRAALASD